MAEVVRLVAEVVGDRKGQISRNKVDGHLATGGTTNRLLTDTIKCGDVSGVQVTPHSTPDAIDHTIDRRGPRSIVRSIVYDYH